MRVFVFRTCFWSFCFSLFTHFILIFCMFVFFYIFVVVIFRCYIFFFFSSRRRHTRLVSDWSSDVCSSDLEDAINDRPGEPYDDRILVEIGEDLVAGQAVDRAFPIRNVDRAVGARIASAIARKRGDAGLPDGAITLHFAGSAGQSFGAWCVGGMRLRLVGEANDYVGKGMTGGEIMITPPEPLRGASSRHVIVGNTVLYGATGGRLFAAGRAGERFAVRNSGAVAVVEGVGDHGCEYMTGGTVVVLGDTGRNFGAGRTGGSAFVLDEQGTFERRLNPALVTAGRLSDPGDAAPLDRKSTRLNSSH